MDEYKASDLLEMGLMEKSQAFQTEVVFLRNLERRTKLYTDFTEATAVDHTMNGVEWGRDPVAAKDGVKCKANIVLCSVGAKIPQTSTAAAVTINPKLQFPKQALAKWVKEYLTSVHIKYKGCDKIVVSEPSQYKIDRFFEFLPKTVHEQTAAISEKFVVDNRDTQPRLMVGNVTIK